MKPIPCYAGTRTDASGWWVLALEDGHPLVGSFTTPGEAGEIADAISAGQKWRYGPSTREWLTAKGYL